MNLQPLVVLPPDLQRDFGAAVYSALPTGAGVYRLVNARRTVGNSFEGQRITVQVVDENGQAIPGVAVAFSFSTADRYILTSDFQWIPPDEHRAFIARTSGGGQCDMVLGAEGVVKAGGQGGVTVYPLTPEYSSDFVTGCGMLADHSGMFLTFALYRAGVVPLDDRLDNIEARIAALESKHNAIVGVVLDTTNEA